MQTSPPIRKTITFISRKSPYGSAYAKACLDMVLSTAVFEQQVNLVFMDDGVLQLQAAQRPAAIDAKDLSAALTALPIYDVESIYADAESLKQRGMEAANLIMQVKLCSAARITALIKESNVVFNI
jgi:tRNA 2-thiouridine synthesizing protein C